MPPYSWILLGSIFQSPLRGEQVCMRLVCLMVTPQWARSSMSCFVAPANMLCSGATEGVPKTVPSWPWSPLHKVSLHLGCSPA